MSGEPEDEVVEDEAPPVDADAAKDDDDDDDDDTGGHRIYSSLLGVDLDVEERS